MDFVFTLLVSVIAAVVVKWLWDRHNVQQTWQRLGIKGPKSSSIFFGNFGETSKEGTFVLLAKWTKLYGKVFGYYQAGTPTLVTADPDMVREILIKQFDKFEKRVFIADNTKDPLNSLVEQSGEQWKKVRGLSSPTFSAKRMKQMSPMVHKSIDKLIELFQERAKNGSGFDVAEDWKRLTLDVIASTVFSYDTDVFNQTDNIFLQKLIELFKSLDPKQATWKDVIKLTFAIVFPGGVTFLRLFNPRAIAGPNQWFLDLAKRMVEDRLTTGEFRNDYIQLMLIHGGKRSGLGSVSGGETDTDISDNETRQTVRDLKRQAKTKELTLNEMQGQVFVFLAAGYETTSTTLAYFSHYMVLYPEVQAKLQAEIDEFFPNLETKPVNYETVQALPYLEMAFCETSRLASIAQIVTTRMCNQDTEVCGYHIPKGAKILINMMEIHQDPDLWGPEPLDQFVPERFTKDRKSARHSMAYLPFGSGPRNCIGMRFAIMEAKMAIINTLKRFSIERCDDTKVPLKLATDGIRGPTEGVYVKLVQRK